MRGFFERSGWHAVPGGPVTVKASGALRAARYAMAIWCCLLLLLTPPALAGSATYGDVTINLDPPPGDSSNYGYAVYRLTVTNRGPAARTVTVTLPAQSYGGGDHLRSLTKTLRVGPNATAAADLTQPAISLSGNSARVAIDGSAQRDLLPVDLVDHDAYGEGDPILVGRGVPEAVRVSLLDGLNVWQERLDNASTSGFGRHGIQPVPELVRADRPATEFSDNWLFYSRYLAVMLGEAEARQLAPPAAAALRSYVDAGGIVILVGDSMDVPPLPNAWSGSWNTPLKHDGPPGGGVEVSSGFGRFVLLAGESIQQMGSNNLEVLLENWRRATADRRVVVGAEGAESRLPMLENIAVPVRGLLILMLVFTLVIGPANLMVLHWLKRRMWLLWTIPVIAFTFAGAVLIYSLLSEGHLAAGAVGGGDAAGPDHPAGRHRRGHRLLRPAHPRRGPDLRRTNSRRPAVRQRGLRLRLLQLRPPPHHQPHERPTPRPAAGSSRASPPTSPSASPRRCASGWTSAATPRAEGLRVVNGLGKPIRSLHLMDADGRGYVGGWSRAPGASAVVGAADGHVPVHEELRCRCRSCLQHLRGLGHRRDRSVATPPYRYHLEPSTYLAVLDNATFLEPGLADLTDHEATGVVVGYWGEGE